MTDILSGDSFGAQLGDALEQQSQWARFLTRAARTASPEDARKLGESAARILHSVVSRQRPTHQRNRKLP